MQFFSTGNLKRERNIPSTIDRTPGLGQEFLFFRGIGLESYQNLFDKSIFTPHYMYAKFIK
jgi:hypothetical protein